MSEKKLSKMALWHEAQRAAERARQEHQDTAMIVDVLVTCQQAMSTSKPIRVKGELYYPLSFLLLAHPENNAEALVLDVTAKCWWAPLDAQHLAARGLRAFFVGKHSNAWALKEFRRRLTRIIDDWKQEGARVHFQMETPK